MIEAKYALVLVAIAAVGTSGSAAAELPETVDIGGVFTLNTWQPYANEAAFVAEQAVEDFNAYLDALGADWSLDLSVEDAGESAGTSTQKVTAMKGKGINLLVGMGWSSHILDAKSYVDSNDMLVISYASQAVSLSTPDSIFRLVPNDGAQAPVVVAMLERSGVEVVLPVLLNDAWGNGMLDGVTSLAAENNMTLTFVDAIKYANNPIDLSAEAGFVDQQLGKLLDDYDAEKIAVVFVGTEEFELLIESLKWYENPSKVRWFGTNTQAKSPSLADNADTVKFAQDTMFEASRSVSESNAIKQYVDDLVSEKYDREPFSYTYSAYDSVWLLGLTLLQTQTTDVDALTDALPLVAQRSYGSVGSLAVDENGDLASSAFETWSIVNGQWVKQGTYDAATQTIQ